MVLKFPKGYSPPNIFKHSSDYKEGMKVSTDFKVNNSISRLRTASFKTSSATFVDVTDTDVSLTTVGAPVLIIVIGSCQNDTANTSAHLRAIRDDATASTHQSWTEEDNDEGSNLQSASMSWIDTPPAGIHKYEVQLKRGGGVGGTADVLDLNIFAMELVDHIIK